ncbi:MAG: hypothetical protein RI885_1038 [Actinomycetota bacterium]
MVDFRAMPVTDAAARVLLTDYFAARAASFPGGPSAYRTSFPEPHRFVPPRGVFVVARSEMGSDVGCGGIRLLDPLGGRRHGAGVTRFELKHLWVDPGARSTGVGAALLDELEARARAFGASELVLDTHVAQEAAGRLYARTGFVPISAYNDNPNATVWLGKNLTTELE